MREDIRRKKYKKLYKQVDELYCEQFLNITQACKKLKISPRTYHHICKELGRPSVAKERPKPVKKVSRKTRQTGGNNDGGNDQEVGTNNEQVIDIPRESTDVTVHTSRNLSSKSSTATENGRKSRADKINLLATSRNL